MRGEDGGRGRERRAGRGRVSTALLAEVQHLLPSQSQFLSTLQTRPPSGALQCTCSTLRGRSRRAASTQWMVASTCKKAEVTLAHASVPAGKAGQGRAESGQDDRQAAAAMHLHSSAETAAASSSGNRGAVGCRPTTILQAGGRTFGHVGALLQLAGVVVPSEMRLVTAGRAGRRGAAWRFTVGAAGLH